MNQVLVRLRPDDSAILLRPEDPWEIARLFPEAMVRVGESWQPFGKIFPPDRTV